MQNEVSKATVSKSGKVRKNYILATLQRTSLLITLPGTNFKVNSRRLGKFSVRPIVLPPSQTVRASPLVLERAKGLRWFLDSSGSSMGDQGLGEAVRGGCRSSRDTSGRTVVAVAVLLDH